MQKKKKRRPVVKGLLIALFAIIVVGVGAFVLVTHYYPLRYISIIDEYSAEYGLPPELVCAVIHTESKFSEGAVSSKGASGLMQIGESTADWLADKMNLSGFSYDQIFDPEINIRLGCYYLGMLERQYGDMEVALCAYNAGNGTVNGWLQNPAYSDDGKTLKSIPYRETQNYVKRVADNQKIYALLLKFS